MGTKNKVHSTDTFNQSKMYVHDFSWVHSGLIKRYGTHFSIEAIFSEQSLILVNLLMELIVSMQTVWKMY